MVQLKIDDFTRKDKLQTKDKIFSEIALNICQIHVYLSVSWRSRFRYNLFPLVFIIFGDHRCVYKNICSLFKNFNSAILLTNC